VGSDWKEIPGTGSLWMVFDSLTMRGLGPYIINAYLLIIYLYSRKREMEAKIA
jgi:hypothetical protein